MRKKDRVPLHDHTPHRRRLRTAVLTGAVALGLSLLGASPALAAPTTASVALTATPSVTVGDTVDVGIGLVGAADVYAYEVTLSYDPALFSYVADSATAPAGGYDTVKESAGSVTLVHSRLGTSPSLGGDVAASLQLTALASGSGSAALNAASVTLVDPAGETTTLTDAATAAVTIAPLASETPTPTPSPTATTTPGGNTDPASTTTAGSGSGSLAATGFGIGALLIVAAAAVAAGVLVLLRRRTAGSR
ncbi:cohesin domain-containing protein [Herbiconiux ginsengi]|uniref:Cohesin domain-containing protein n=1 Tax=Herbiconiux ginsengi TaxID=381665 RepID=A0A1H3T0Z4_9MICO|nr:cohesin domain-containing protein [Herbiconiux ginsengi]SDZ43700.1 Cohesin domain-containing protein [Herbiconiux ginsengi]